MGEGIKKRVKSLLVGTNPKSKESDFKEELDKYIKEIKQSIQTLKQIYNLDNKKVKLAFYDEEPLVNYLSLK